MQPLLYDYNEYGERVAMRTFQSTPEGDPSHVEDTGAKTAWHFHEATGSLLRKEYADGTGPEYTYTEAGQMSSRAWAREGAGSGLAGSGLASDEAPDPAVSDSVPPKSKTANGKIATSYAYDAITAQLTQTASTDGTNVTYAYNSEGQLQKVTDATGAREFTYDLRGQITKESVTLLTGEDTPPLTYEINRSYTALGQPKSVHLVSGADPDNLKPGTSNLKLSHEVAYEWNDHNQLSRVKSLAGEFTYGYNEHNPALLTKMTGPFHSVETTYEPHRNLITSVVNKAKSSTGILPVHRDGTTDPQPTAPSLADPSQPSTKNEEPGTILSSYVYANDLLGRRETISQGGSAFAMLPLGENKIEVVYNDRSEVIAATTRRGDTPVARQAYAYEGIGNRTSARSSVGPSAVGSGQTTETKYESNALNQYSSIRENSSSFVVQNSSFDLDGNLIEDTRNTYT